MRHWPRHRASRGSVAGGTVPATALLVGPAGDPLLTGPAGEYLLVGPA